MLPSPLIRRLPRVIAVLLLAALCLTTGAAEAQEQSVITLADGTQFVGIVQQRTAEQVRIKSEATGQSKQYPADQVKQIQSRRQFAAAMQKQLDDLNAGDGEKIDERYAIAQKMFFAGLVKEAHPVLNDLVTEAPDDVRINRLKSVVDAQLRQIEEREAREAAQNQQPGERPGTGSTDQNFTGRLQEVEDPFLDREAQTLIQIYELPQNLDEADVRITIPRGVMNDVLKKYADSPDVPKGREAQRDLLRADGSKHLELLFKLRAKEYYNEVRLNREPQTMRDWGQLNRTYVASYFAKHFGAGALPLHLYTTRPTSQDEAYTNFYLLDRYTYAGNAMINRSTPADSLLLEWGLPRRDAKFPAPPIDGWRPYFTGKDDPRYDQILTWIKSLYPLQPDYGISYKPATYDVAPVIPDPDAEVGEDQPAAGGR